MNARYYVPGVGRFASADSLVPAPANPQSLNRYSYVNNNPLNATDPSGHCPWCLVTGAIGGVVTGATYYWTTPAHQRNRTDAALAISAGVVGGVLIGTGVGAGAGAAVIASVGAGTGLAVSAEAYLIGNAITDSEFNRTDFVVASGIGMVEGAIAPFAGAGSILVSGAAGGVQSALSDTLKGNEVNYRSAASATAVGLMSGGVGYRASQINFTNLVTPKFARPIPQDVGLFDRAFYISPDPSIRLLKPLIPPKSSAFIRGTLRNFGFGIGTELIETGLQSTTDRR